MAPALRPSPNVTRRSRPVLLLAVPVAVGWLWSMGLLLQRVHVVYDYYVSSVICTLRGWLLSLLVAVHPTLFWMTFLAAAVGWMAGRALRLTWPAWARAVLVLGFWAVPLLDLARLAWPALPVTFLEPIFLAALTGWVVHDFVRLRLSRSSSSAPAPRATSARLWFLAVLLAAAAMGAWWFWLSHQAYRDYQLGYFDFGHFARRVVSTWRGYGFLQQTPGLPPFWDHFNPGLAALAPLWGLWPDAHLFFALQAVCLAAPALCVYGIACRLRATPAAAAAWALAYLAWPVVQQLNYNFSYGWHPVSTALPLMMAAAYCLVSGRKIAALLLALAACSFKEDVLITMVGFAAGLALLAWRESKRATPDAPTFPWLPRARASLIVAAAFLAATITIFATMDFARYQVSRHSVLGDTAWGVLLSPVLRPRVFWPEVLSDRSLIFLLALFLPFGLANAVRGWPVQVALAIPVAALLAWHNANAKSIAFQYVTCPIFVITFAALVGTRRSAVGRSHPATAMTVGALTALATALSMSLVFGTLPSTPPTTPFHTPQNLRDAWTAHCRRLDHAVAMINKPDASVMASGRAAAHLLGVRRLEPLSDALDRRGLIAREAGPGKIWLDAFEWVLLDRQDVLQLGRDTVETVATMCADAGFQVRYSAGDVILLQRPPSR